MTGKRRRGAGEGTIRQRPGGSWEARVSLPDGSGGSRRVGFYGKTRREVQQQLTKVCREVDTGVYVAPAKLTVGEYLPQWLEHKKSSLRSRTWEGYEDHVSRNITPVIGRIPLQKLTRLQVQQLVNLKSKSLAPRTVSYMRAILRAALNQAIQWDLIQRNAAEGLAMPRLSRSAPAVLSPDQAKRLLSYAQVERLGPLFSVAMAVGLRLGEVLGLQWGDIDFERKTLTVRRALQRSQGQVRFVEPKSDKSRRTVVLPEFSVSILKTHRIVQLEERMAAGDRWQEWGLVFATPIGTPLDDSNVRKVFKGLLKAAGLPDMRIHDLRHTCATLLLVQGVHPKLVQETLGHSQIALTLDTYSHMMPTMKEEVASKMDAVLAS